MACEYCTDEDGNTCLPQYGLAPHTHLVNTKTLASDIVYLPPSSYPQHFKPDPEDLKKGTWYCPHCKEGLNEQAPQKK